MSKFGKCFDREVEPGSLNLNFFFGWMSSSGGILESTSVAAGCWDGCSSSACISADLSFLVGDV